MRPFAILVTVVASVVSGAGGYLVARRTQPPPRAVHCAEPSAPESIAAAPSCRESADVQALKNQLAICMAYHPARPDVPGHDLMTDALAGCQSQLELMKNPPRDSLPSCYDFADLAPVYDRELGLAGDTSAETLDRAQRLTAEDCGRVLHYAASAVRRHRACMGGAMPAGWKERYGALIDERPFVKVCNALPDYARQNAVLAFDEARAREAGVTVQRHVRMTPDGTLTDDSDGRHIAGVDYPDAGTEH